MKSITRQLKRFSERFTRAIDRDATVAEFPRININNPTANHQTAPGAITNNNQNIINVFYTGTPKAKVRLVCATWMNMWLMKVDEPP